MPSLTGEIDYMILDIGNSTRHLGNMFMIIFKSGSAVN